MPAKKKLKRRLRTMFSSHGEWSTIGNIRKVEKERGNRFPILSYPSKTPAIWATKTRRKAARYLALAEDWEYLSSNKPLTKEQKQLVREVVPVRLSSSDHIIHPDPDEGYLIVRSRTKRKHKSPLL